MFLAPNGLLGTTSVLEASSELTRTDVLLDKSNSPDIGTEPTDLEDLVSLNRAPTFTLTGLLSKVKSKEVDKIDSNSGGGDFGGPSLTFTRTQLLEGSDSPWNLDSSSSSTTFGCPSLLVDDHGASATTNSVPATTFSGKTIFLKKRARRHVTKTLTTTTTFKFSDLLGTPIHRLLEDLAMNTAQNMSEATPGPSSAASNDTTEDTLWVDRYRPTCFTDLVGNDRVARDTMAWVKQWDYCVFGKTKGKKRQRDSDENYNPDDEYLRPREKILLLSGPPGLGKTTLAHIVARHAGYDVLEINASDARTGSIVDDRIRPTLEAGSLVNSTKPVLVVIDEIDGATGAGENPGSFINNLVQLTQNRRKKKRGGQRQQPSAQTPLLRPIICICNDVNASSLAKLRPHAYQVRFTRPADFHTVRRLQEICDNEVLKAEARALNTLVAMAKGDLRGCINTLQFIKSRRENVTETVIRKATVGMKEGDTTVVAVLNSIFSPMSKKRVKELGMTEEQESRYVNRLSYEIESSGKDGAIAGGCFAHYATLRQHDANFSRYESANEWLITYDALSSSMFADGDFALLPYLPFSLVPFCSLFQTRTSERIERNYSDWEHYQLTKSNEEIYASFARCLRNATLRQEGGAYRHLVSSPILQLEFTPFINRIISPPLRPVNSQVIRAEERQLLVRLVDIMAALGLRFILDRGDNGQLSYRLEPPIDVFVTYDGKRTSDIAASRYAVRHLVATEVDAKLAAQDQDGIEKGKGSKRTKQLQSDHAEVEPFEPASKRQKTAQQDKGGISDEKTPKDFFGRAITVKPTSNSKSAARKQTEELYRVSYKFNEGNSAAVRKPVKLNSFL